MKIMQVIPKMDVGGVERGVVDLARYFKDKEDEIIVVSSGGRLTEELKLLGAKYYRLNVHRKSLASLLLIKKMREIIRRENIDIVHARSRVPGWISFFATRGTNADFITTAHGFYSVHLLSRVMGWGKFVICPSKIIARHMQDDFGVERNKIIIIPRWVNLRKFKFSPERDAAKSVSIVSIGRLSPSKGYEYLIRAMRRVVRDNPYANLSIIGSADPSKERYVNYLKSLVQRYSLNYHIKFAGYHSNVDEILSKANLLVMPSVVKESFGRVIIEAFAVGTPVVATRIGAVLEIIEDKKTGFLVNPRDVDDLSNTILSVLKNRPMVKRVVLNAREKAEKYYSLDCCLADTHKVYKKTKELKRILIIKLTSLGDIILAVPSIKAIKENYPESEVCLLTLKSYASIFYDCPYVDRVIPAEKDYKRLRYIKDISSVLRRMSFDYIVDLQNNHATHLIAFLSFGRKSFGFSRKLGFLLSAKAQFPYDKSVDPLSSQERILRLLGITFKEKKLVFWDAKEPDISRYKLKKGRIIGINVSAAAKWKTKNWPLDNLRKFIEMVHRELKGYRVVLVGDKDSEERALILQSSLKKKAINLSGKTTLRELVAVVKKFDAFITPDTATLHLAQSLGIPTIALFGPTDPSAHTVKSSNLHVIVKKLDCSFCYKPVCPTCECMRSISPSEVLSRLKTALGIK